jgi:hypothetical protein
MLPSDGEHKHPEFSALVNADVTLERPNEARNVRITHKNLACACIDVGVVILVFGCNATANGRSDSCSLCGVCTGT